MNSRICRKLKFEMLLLVSSGHIILCPSKGHQHGVSIETFINLGKTFFLHISHMKCRTDLTLGKPFCMFIFFQKPENLQSLFKLITTTQFFNLYFCSSLCLQSSQWIIPLWYDKSRCWICVYLCLLITLCIGLCGSTHWMLVYGTDH